MRKRSGVLLVLGVLCVSLLISCPPPVSYVDFISPPDIYSPIHNGTEIVAYKDATAGYRLKVYANGSEFLGEEKVTPWGWGPVKVNRALKVGDKITATQSNNGDTGHPTWPADTITVGNVPTEKLFGKEKLYPPKMVGPIYDCQNAARVESLIEGVAVFSEISSLPPVGPLWTPYPYTFVVELFKEGQKVKAKQTLPPIADSDYSPDEPVQPKPSSLNDPKYKPEIVKDVDNDGTNDITVGTTLITICNLITGATVDIYQPPGSTTKIGGGIAGGPCTFFPVTPLTSTDVSAEQSLCELKSPPSDPVTPKNSLGLPEVQQPICPGATNVKIQKTELGAYVEIQVNGKLKGNASAAGATTTVNVGGGIPLNAGDEIIVQQSNAVLKSGWTAPPIKVESDTGLSACTKDWPAFRHDMPRSGQQPNASTLSDPKKVSTLHIGASWQPRADSQSFRASPIVYDGIVYIGNGNGRFYALNATTLSLLWQYPPANAPALISKFTCNPSSAGISSSAVIANINGTDAVIFGAPDQSIGAHLGSGRLFALNAKTGAEIWKSPEIARLTGTSPANTSEFHEQIGYSAPVVSEDRVYVGVANHCDNPIQQGRVVAVDPLTGNIGGGFNFAATNTRGGGVWSAVAAGLGSASGLYVTTGNVRAWNGGSQPEPAVNHALSLLRLDRNTGDVIWKHQPVPFALDDDPDWAAGAAVMPTSCGTLAASTMKDGWTYAVRAGYGTPGPPSVLLQFPPTGFPFTPGDKTVHGDTRFLRPGAAWGDVFITNAGGLNLTTDLDSNYPRLHALNVCASGAGRIRWIKDVPGVSGVYSLGPPTVSRGIVFVGTQTSHLVVIADPSVFPPAGYRCSHPDVTVADCIPNGFTIVPDPAVLANVPLEGPIRTEPALAGGRVYVATDNGQLYMLEP